MYNFSNCTAEHCVCAIFCRVSHRVKSPITTPNDLSLSLQFIHQVGSVSFPVSQNSRNRNLLWCTKYVRALYIQIPRCLSTRSTLLTDAPAMRMAKLSNIFPAGYLPSTKGWDLHMKALGPQFPQHCVTVTIVPFFCIETFGPSPLHLKQISENRARSCV